MRLTTAYPIKTAGGGLALVLTIATAVAAVQTTDLKFRPSQFRTESAVAAWDTGAKAGTVPRSARTRGTVPIFPVLALGLELRRLES